MNNTSLHSAAQIQLKVLPGETSLQVDLAKEITENTKFDAMDFSVFTKAKEVVVDFERVNYINSSGVRSWIHWNQRVLGLNPNLIFIFKHCPKVVVDQINYIGQFMPPGSVVDSLYVPFYDKDRDQIKNVLLKRGVDFREASAGQKEFITLPQVKSEQGVELELDVSPEIYFKFLSQRLQGA